jgi:uncharacterized alkaline shock family protein YloU
MDGAWEERPTGTTTIAPGVLVTIARLTALGVPGVTRMAPVAGGVNRLFRRGASEGVRIEVSENTVSVDLYLVLGPATNVRDVSRKVRPSRQRHREHGRHAGGTSRRARRGL